MRRLLIVLAAASLTVTGLAFAADPPATTMPLNLGVPNAGADLPELGSPASTVLSHQDEYRLGAMVAKELRDQNALIEDPEVSEYINAVGDRLAAQSQDGARDFQFFVIKDSTINAFAVPGGYIFVHAGLLLATTSESELASVMAHEIAHVTQHHIARQLRAQSTQQMTSIAAMLGAIILGAVSGGQAAEGAIAAAQGMSIQSQINFSRATESEADRVGIGYLAAAGYEPNAMGAFFETMSRHEGLTVTYIPAILIDHPVTTDRIAEAKSRAAQFPKRQGRDSQSYELIRERVRVLDPDATDLASYYEHHIASDHGTLGDRYGLALVLMNTNHAEEAVRQLTELVQQHEDLTLLYVALAQAQGKAGHVKESLATFQRAQRLFPRNVPVTVRYAEALMANGQAAEAHTKLLDLFNNVPPTPDQIRLTALAASAANDPGDAYFYMGEYQIAGGDLNLAAQQFQLALASPHITPIQRQRYQARLDEVRDYLMSMHKRQVADSGDQGQRGGGH